MGQAYVLSNWIDYAMDMQASLDAARFFLYDGELSVETGVPQETRRLLAERGHRLVDADSPHGEGRPSVSIGKTVFYKVVQTPERMAWRQGIDAQALNY